MTRRQAVALTVTLALVALAVTGVVAYRRARAGYDAYRAQIQQGISAAGVDIGGRTPEEARALLVEKVAKPYYESFSLRYQEQEIALDPDRDLSLDVDVDGMVKEAYAASHQTDYWQGFQGWLKGDVITLTLDVPLSMTFDLQAAEVFLSEIAGLHDRAPVEPMVDVQEQTFIPGQPGRRLQVEESARSVNEAVPVPGRRSLDLEVALIEPDQSPARIASMLNTLVPVMEVVPVAPSFYTATLPLSSTGGLEGTPLVTYTGELTWTFPHFADYQGPLTTTYGYFFDPGKPGARFDVLQAIEQVNTALGSGATGPIHFEAAPVPPPTITRDLLVRPLEDRLAGFAGVYSLFVKNLASGEVVYDHNTRIVLSGMSVVKVGIMVEVYRATKGSPDKQTRDELLAMLGSESCNPCANRLMSLVGSGSATTGAQRITNTMKQVGLANFRLCGPYRLQTGEGRPEDGVPLASLVPPGTSMGANARLPAPFSAFRLAALSLSPAASAVPGYDRCVHATPREMADLLEMVHACSQGKGKLRSLDPTTFSPATCQEMLDIMAANDLRNMLGAGIPAEVKLAHKHGFAGYDAPWGDTRAEVGIVFSPGATWLVSFYIWQDSPWIDYGIVQPLYRDVTNLLYNYFNPLRPYWPLPPWVPPPEPAVPAAATNKIRSTIRD